MYDHISREDRIRRFGKHKPQGLKFTLITLSGIVSVVALWFVLAELAR